MKEANFSHVSLALEEGVKRAKTGRRSDKTLLIDSFYEFLNKRQKTSYMCVRQKLAQVPMDDLIWFFHRCDKSDNFNKTFWSLLKEKGN